MCCVCFWGGPVSRVVVFLPWRVVWRLAALRLPRPSLFSCVSAFRVGVGPLFRVWVLQGCGPSLSLRSFLLLLVSAGVSLAPARLPSLLGEGAAPWLGRRWRQQGGAPGGGWAVPERLLPGLVAGALLSVAGDLV